MVSLHRVRHLVDHRGYKARSFYERVFGFLRYEGIQEHTANLRYSDANAIHEVHQE